MAYIYLSNINNPSHLYIFKQEHSFHFSLWYDQFIEGIILYARLFSKSLIKPRMAITACLYLHWGKEEIVSTNIPKWNKPSAEGFHMSYNIISFGLHFRSIM